MMSYKIPHRILYTAIICGFFLLSTGCEREWHFTLIRPIADNPRFCISRYSDCKGNGVTLAGLNIDEVNEKGELIRTMWVIVPESSSALKKLTYGIVPKGYKETTKAIPLEIDKIYSVLGRYYFRLKRSDSSIEAEIYNIEEFNKKFKWSAQ